MLAVGTRFTEEETLGFQMRLPDTLLHIDIDAAEIGRNYQPTSGIVGDARTTLQLLHERLADQQPRDGTQRSAEIARMRDEILRDCRELAPAGVELVQTLRTALPRQTFIVSDLTQLRLWRHETAAAGALWPHPRRRPGESGFCPAGACLWSGGTARYGPRPAGSRGAGGGRIRSHLGYRYHPGSTFAGHGARTPLSARNPAGTIRRINFLLKKKRAMRPPGACGQLPKRWK